MNGVLVFPFDVHVMVALPGLTPVTTPSADIVAMEVSLLAHVTFAVLGYTESVCEVPVNRFMEFAVTTKFEVGEYGLTVTVVLVSSNLHCLALAVENTIFFKFSWFKP